MGWTPEQDTEYWPRSWQVWTYTISGLENEDPFSKRQDLPERRKSSNHMDTLYI